MSKKTIDEQFESFGWARVFVPSRALIPFSVARRLLSGGDSVVRLLEVYVFGFRLARIQIKA